MTQPCLPLWAERGLFWQSRCPALVKVPRILGRVWKPSAPFSRCSLLGPGGSLGSQGVAWHKWGAGLGHRAEVWPQLQPPAYSLWNLGLLETRGCLGLCCALALGSGLAHPGLPFLGLILEESRVDADSSATTSWPSVSCPAAGQMWPSSFKHPRCQKVPGNRALRKETNMDVP